MTELPGWTWPDYDMTEPRHAGAHYGPECPGCRIRTEQSEGYICWIPGCPAHGLAADSAEAARAAAARERELSGWPGDLELEHAERAAWLGLMAAAGEMLAVEIEHGTEG